MKNCLNAETRVVLHHLVEECDDIEAFTEDVRDLDELAERIRQDYDSYSGGIEEDQIIDLFIRRSLRRVNWRQIAQHLVVMLARRAEKGGIP